MIKKHFTSKCLAPRGGLITFHVHTNVSGFRIGRCRLQTSESRLFSMAGGIFFPVFESQICWVWSAVRVLACVESALIGCEICLQTPETNQNCYMHVYNCAYSIWRGAHTLIQLVAAGWHARSLLTCQTSCCVSKAALGCVTCVCLSGLYIHRALGLYYRSLFHSLFLSRSLSFRQLNLRQKTVCESR